ncbi:aldehyde dehydrogenase domain-containing protein [Boletus edulis BED1]|uniref:Aldehyde dehydrogenase domain-containing protein n=1 Tax=Boletus edulis BED1 TaxID=1328754 RepID=A0AAD4C6W2_BOLED|nr:aldehyde dehydrogenase domain-containing protein [Boletus edulis BED1]
MRHLLRHYSLQHPRVPPLTICNPATGEVVFSVDAATAKDVDVSVTRAHTTYQSGVWSRAPPLTRSTVLSRLARLLEEHTPAIANIETLQTGRAIRELTAQIGRLPEWLHYYAAVLRTHQGFVAPTQGKLLNYVQRIPLGVVAQITPFNHPLFIAVKKIAPALAAGNSVIVKPSELAPVSLLEFSKLTQEAGVPDGVFTVLPGYGHTTGKQIASHPLVRKVDITAGTQTGRALGAVVGANLAAFTAELGGKAPVVVFDDADLPSAVNGVAFASFIASGQTCVSGTRIIVQENIYDKFMHAFLDKVKGIRQRMGDPLNPQSSMGSVISSKQLERIEQMVQNRKSGEIVAGGERMSGKSALDDFDFSRGSFYPPTVITNVNTKDEIWQEEIFGPVVVVNKFREEEEGVALANACKYGLGAGIWTCNLPRAHRVADAIEAGLVWVNTHHRNDPSSPWGGMKDSGIGRENGYEAFEAYSQSKSVIVNTATTEESRFTDDWFADGGGAKRYG